MKLIPILFLVLEVFTMKASGYHRNYHKPVLKERAVFEKSQLMNDESDVDMNSFLKFAIGSKVLYKRSRAGQDAESYGSDSNNHLEERCQPPNSRHCRRSKHRNRRKHHKVFQSQEKRFRPSKFSASKSKSFYKSHSTTENDKDALFEAMNYKTTTESSPGIFSFLHFSSDKLTSTTATSTREDGISDYALSTPEREHEIEKPRKSSQKASSRRSRGPPKEPKFPLGPNGATGFKAIPEYGMVEDFYNPFEDQDQSNRDYLPPDVAYYNFEDEHRDLFPYTDEGPKVEFSTESTTESKDEWIETSKESISVELSMKNKRDLTPINNGSKPQVDNSDDGILEKLYQRVEKSRSREIRVPADKKSFIEGLNHLVDDFEKLVGTGKSDTLPAQSREAIKNVSRTSFMCHEKSTPSLNVTDSSKNISGRALNLQTVPTSPCNKKSKRDMQVDTANESLKQGDGNVSVDSTSTSTEKPVESSSENQTASSTTISGEYSNESNNLSIDGVIKSMRLLSEGLLHDLDILSNETRELGNRTKDEISTVNPGLNTSTMLKDSRVKFSLTSSTQNLLSPDEKKSGNKNSRAKRIANKSSKNRRDYNMKRHLNNYIIESMF